MDCDRSIEQNKNSLTMGAVLFVLEVSRMEDNPLGLQVSMSF
jgi:hypothetical protein